jgi:hypothetical protein
MSLQFLTGHPAPDGSASHLPMEFGGGYSDEQVREQWARRPPDYVFWLDEEMAYFGGARFCATYGQRSCAFLLERYLPVVGPVSSRFGTATLLARPERPAR